MRFFNSGLVGFRHFAGRAVLLGTMACGIAVLGLASIGSAYIGNAYAEEVLADNGKFIEGEHYEVLPIAVDTADPESLEVVEVFSYMCVHCYNFDPAVSAWSAAQADNVDFVRVPAIFNDDWESLAQAYYAAEVLGVSEEVHMPIFNAIHAKQIDLRRPELLAKIFADEASVSKEDFDQAFNSFSVRSRVQQAKAKGRAYRVTGVPTLIVNGKYRVDGRMAGNNTRMLQVVDFLVAKEAAGG
jgi:thiol:disulfide interchange protein DsbA